MKGIIVFHQHVILHSPVYLACLSCPSHNGKTPLLCAAEAGHDEIVAYLLEFTKVRTDLEKETKKVAKNASVSYSCITYIHDCVYINKDLPRKPIAYSRD